MRNLLVFDAGMKGCVVFWGLQRRKRQCLGGVLHPTDHRADQAPDAPGFHCGTDLDFFGCGEEQALSQRACWLLHGFRATLVCPSFAPEPQKHGVHKTSHLLPEATPQPSAASSTPARWSSCGLSTAAGGGRSTPGMGRGRGAHAGVCVAETTVITMIAACGIAMRVYTVSGSHHHHEKRRS